MAVEKIARLLRQVETSAAPGPVHHLRTSIRRLEAELAEALQSKPKLVRRLHRLRRRAGRVRDLDVQLELLRGLPGVDTAGDGTFHLLVRAMTKERERHGQRLSAWLTASRRRQLARRLRRLASAAAPVSPQQHLAAAWAGFADLDRRTTTLDPSNLHAFRTDCKRLRYQAEMALPLRSAALLRDQLRQVQDAIGAWHDWVELAARARRAVDGGTPTALGALLEHTAAAEFARSLSVAARVRGRLRRGVLPAPHRLPPGTQGASAAARRGLA